MEKQLETYLYENIPLSHAMGVHVVQASLDKIVLSAPLANNINHKKTAFGGSLHAVATLAGWCLVHINLKKACPEPCQIVITKSEIDYLGPVEADFQAVCLMPAEEEWQHFLKVLKVKGRARIHLAASIYHRDRLAVDYRGVFAAIKTKPGI